MSQKEHLPPVPAWPLTPENVNLFHEANGDLRLNGYAIATNEFVKVLTALLAKTSEFKELEADLTSFVQDRKEFSDWLDPKLNMNTGRYDLK